MTSAFGLLKSCSGDLGASGSSKDEEGKRGGSSSLGVGVCPRAPVIMTSSFEVTMERVAEGAVRVAATLEGEEGL